jgi:hypothetical protein
MDGAFRYELGLVGNIAFSNSVSFRPSLLLSFEKNEVTYTGIRASGAPFAETMDLQTAVISFPLPFTFRFSRKNIAPYLMAGPTVSFFLQAEDEVSLRFPLKPVDILGDIGFGVDIAMAKSRAVLSPELKYSRGLLNAKETTANNFSNAISTYTRQHFTFSLYLRKQ